MRILVVTNLYPPFHKSGYGLGCEDIVRSLKSRAHHIQVITSTYGIQEPQTLDDTHRVLTMNSEDYPNWKDVFRKEFTNQTTFKKICAEFDPEISFFFDLSHVSLSLIAIAEKLGLPSCTYYANNWFVTEELDQWHQLWPEGSHGFRILRSLTRRFDLLPPQPRNPSAHSIFASEYLRHLAIQLKKTNPDAPVIPWGIDADRFPYKKLTDQKLFRLLVAGQIHREKGIEDVLKALHLLNNKGDSPLFSLSIAGDKKSSPEYVEYLECLADELGIAKHCEFLGPVDPAKMADLYQAHDILVLPSYKEDSPNRTLLEGMSSGIPVVGTATSSNAGILEDEVNGLIYWKGNPAHCAEKIRRISTDSDLKESLRKKARQTIDTSFQLERAVDSLEKELEKAAESGMPAGQLKLRISEKLPGKKLDDASFATLSRQAKRWLTLGKTAVFIRILARPKLLLNIPIYIYKKTIGFTPHRFHAFVHRMYSCLSKASREKNSADASSQPKILVTQLADIGDVVLTSPFLRGLRRHFPKAWIALIVQPRMFSLVEKCPYVDRVIPFDWRSAKNYDRFLRGTPRWWAQSSRLAKKELRNHHPDLAVSTRWNEDPCQAASLILMYASGSRERIAYKSLSSDPMRYGWGDLNRLITQGPERGFPKHEVEHQMDVLRFIGEEPDEMPLEVWTSPEDERYAQNILESEGITPDDVLIAFAPGAAWPFRRWPSGRFVELGRWLQDAYGAVILILAGKSEQDLAFRIEKGLKAEKTINLSGKTTLREMASFLRHCKLFVGNDSGPLHIATAAGTPVVGFYGPGEYHRFKPWGADHDTLRLGLRCSPCSQNCKFREPRCIEGIPVSQAKALLTRKLASILDLS